jgi:hypothetical protein
MLGMVRYPAYALQDAGYRFPYTNEPAGLLPRWLAWPHIKISVMAVALSL